MEWYHFTYYIIFKSSGPDPNGPILTYSSADEVRAERNGTMHLFDEDLLGTLDSVEFLMHMPRNRFDLCDMDEDMIASSYDTPHNIIILPDYILPSILLPFPPTMFVLMNGCNEAVKQECEARTSQLGVFCARDLNDHLLKRLWVSLWQQMSKSKSESTVRDIDVQHLLRDECLKALPTLFYSRQFGETDQFLAKIYNSAQVEQDCVAAQWNYMARLRTLIFLQKQGITERDFTKRAYMDAFNVESRKTRLSVVITLPGVAKHQKKFGLSEKVLSREEQRIIRILGVHRAVARGGVLIELPCLDDAAFQKYRELEQRCTDGTNNRYVWQALISLGKFVGRHCSDYQIQIMRSAKDITVFSDFPIGLAILPGDEVPLQCYKSISYLPLTPLTRRYQQELWRSNQWYLGDHCKVAMAECIPDDEENSFVYRMSSEVYHVLQQFQEEYPNFVVVNEKIDTVNQMRRFISNNLDADILYISAHGHYDNRRNMAGIIVGTEFWMADESLRVPPIVILSACHTSPRGIGSVTIADMFLRNGALAVLGAFIPVNSHRNLILMTRLFTYIAEAQKKYDRYRTLADAWSGVVASNAIHEMIEKSSSFRTWIHSKNKQGTPRIVEFQLERCVNRLRTSHIYSDTIQIIKEMLLEEGTPERFGDVLNQNNYFPESLFYQFLGNPENVFLFNEIFDEYLQKYGTVVYPPFSGF